jgi:hypothetical protein
MINTSPSLGGRKRWQSEAEAMLSARLTMPERSRGRLESINYKY